MPDKDLHPHSKDPVIKNPEEQKKNLKTFEQAQDDIEKAPGMNLADHSDLDEGELARSEGHP